MNPDVLAQLQDIQTPSPIGQWPLAWGWWVVITLALLTLLLVIYRLIKRYQHRKAKREALALLKELEALEPRSKAANINKLLKRVNLAYQSRESIAELSSKEWAAWLNQHNEKAQIAPELLDICYQANCSEEDVHLYYLQAKQWIQKALPLKPVINDTNTAEVNHV